MKVLILLLLLPGCGELIAQTRHDFTMTVDSVERSFIVSRPSGPVPPGGYPVVFMFHGTSGDGEKFYNISNWKEKGEVEKFLSVFPSSLEYCIVDSGRQRRTTKWNCGDLVKNGCPGQDYKDDVKFVRAMIDTMRARFPIDGRKIYASGFSNGGIFVSKLAVEMSDVFAALSASAGGLDSLDAGIAKRNIPFWFTVGTKDDRFYERSPWDELPFNDTTLMYLNKLVRRYLVAFSLAESYTSTSTAITITWLFNTPASSEPATEFRFTLIKGLAHQYPNGDNVPLAMSGPLWQFFSQYSLPLTAIERPPAPRIERIYPNPATDFIVVDGEGEFVLILRTLLGQRVHETAAAGGGLIRLPRLTPGVYHAEIRRGSNLSHRLVRIRK